MRGLTPGRRRRLTLRDAREAGRRFALYEVRFFRCAVRYARTGRERTRRRREHWRMLAIAFAKDLEWDCRELCRLGLDAASRRIADDAGDAVGDGRIAYIASRGLDRALGLQVEFAIHSITGVAETHPYLAVGLN